MKKPDQKNLILIVLILVAVLLGSFFGLQLLQTSADLETVKTALDLLKEDANYRFASEATVSANDKQRSYYQIKGEATAQNRHISGEVLGTPVEVFYVDGIFWQKSGADGNFRQIATGELDQALKFAAELEPPSMLSFAEALSWSFDGLEEINAVRCRKLTIQQARATGWIGQYFDQV
ncbi:MAG: hypothetical protein RR051_07355, partial [Clostridiales bacterium]